MHNVLELIGLETRCYMKKRIISFLLLGTMTISLLVGCGDKETSNNDAQNTEVTENVVTNETVVDTEIETESVTDEIEATEVIEETETQQEQTEESKQPSVTYTYEDMSATMYAKQSVNVRSLPSTDGEKLGALAYSQEVNVTGKCNETGWYRINFNGSVGYVSNNYLLTEKPAEQPKPDNPQPDDPVEPSQPSGERHGGSWDYVGDAYGTYTGATLYTNSTYGTSFSVPSTANVWGYLNSTLTGSTRPVILSQASMYDAGITISLCFSKGGSTETEALEIEKSDLAIGGWTSGETYTTTIGGNTYYCCEITSFNGVSNRLFLARQSAGKIIVYVVMSNSVKVTVDTAKQYISY